jgi:amidase
MSKPRKAPQTGVMNRRQFLKLGTCAGALAFASPLATRGAAPREVAYRPQAFEFEEASVADLQNAMKSGKHTARSIAERYLLRIDEMDKRGPMVNSVIELNPQALAIARRARQGTQGEGRPRAAARYSGAD